jgi:hypothetical protein
LVRLALISVKKGTTPLRTPRTGSVGFLAMYFTWTNAVLLVYKPAFRPVSLSWRKTGSTDSQSGVK